MENKTQVEITRERMIDLLYPKRPAKKPDSKSETPYPKEVSAKRLLAFTWLIINSSSIRGIMGGNTTLTLKLINHRNQSIMRRAKALPFSEENRPMLFKHL
jgi:hypothetical protein